MKSLNNLCDIEICEATHLKNKIENISTREGAFYQSEWFFPFICVAANVFKLFCMAHLANTEHFSYHTKFSFLNIKFYVHVNSPASADKNQFNCEKKRFLSEMSGIISRWVIFKALRLKTC